MDGQPPPTHTRKHTQAYAQARAPNNRTHLRGAHRLAELAGDAALLPRGVAPQHVLAAEPGGQRALLKGVVDLVGVGWGGGGGQPRQMPTTRSCQRPKPPTSRPTNKTAAHRDLGVEEGLERERHPAEHLGDEEGVGAVVQDWGRWGVEGGGCVGGGFVRGVWRRAATAACMHQAPHVE
jgi:hypothetical protein